MDFDESSYYLLTMDYNKKKNAYHTVIIKSFYVILHPFVKYYVFQEIDYDI